MKSRVEKYPILLVILAAVGISLGYQEVRSATAEEASKVLAKNCSVSGCHQGSYPPMGLNLEKERFQEALINKFSGQIPHLKLLDTQNPDQSYLLMKINGSEGIDGKRMPLNSPPLQPEEIKGIAEWVQSLKGTSVEGERSFLKNRVRKPAFWGTNVVNLPTPRAVGKGKFLFRLSHRFFPAVKDGYDAFYGLDGPASILLGLGYGFSDNISLTLTRANVSKEFELSLKWTPWDRTDTDMLFSLAFVGSIGFMTVAQPGETVFREENMRFNIQASLAYTSHSKISLLLVPGYTTNTNPAVEFSQGTFSMGLGGRLLIVDDLSLLLEWIPVLSGYSLESSGWGFGLEKKIGGHVFQLFVLNSVGITTPQFAPGGEFRLSDGEFRIGFNILRWF